MRSDAKASTAGSNQRKATGPGRIFRGASATREPLSRAKGSGAPRARLLVAAAAALALILALVVGSASALQTHELKEVFGSAEQPEFSADRGIAVDQGSGDVLVLETSGSIDEIRRYNSDGTPSNFSSLGSNVIDGEAAPGPDETPNGNLLFSSERQREQIAIDESGGPTDGNIYVTESGRDVVDVFSATGAYLGRLTESTSTAAFGEPCGVAVDENGTVYVGDRGDDRIHVYEPAANPPVNADNTASYATVTDPCTIAAGTGATAGFLFVNASTGAQLRKVDAATGEVKYQLATGGSTVTVNPADGHVFAARNTGSSSTVDEYDASGAELAELELLSTIVPGSTVEGVAVNEGSGEIYVTRSSTNKVEVFEAAIVTQPEVVTEPVSNNTGTKATFNGTVNPDGLELSECFFEWGENVPGEPVYGNTVPCAETPAEIGAGTSPVVVHADVEGLIPQGKGYEYRLVAVNPEASAQGANRTFTTPTTVITQPPSSNTGVRATLAGTVNPDGVELDECFFEWGEGSSGTYTETTPCAETPAEIGTGESPVAVHADLNGLIPQGKGYAYRLVAAYPQATVNGSNQNFFTPNTVVTEAATGVTTTEATLHGTVNPDGTAFSECVFEWGPTMDLTTPYQTYPGSAPCVPGPGGIGSGTSPVEVEADIGGLHPGTPYAYRLVAVNPDGPIVGSQKIVQTLGPHIAATWADSVVRTEATLKAQIDPEGSATTYHIEYGTSEAYGSETPETTVGSDSSLHTVSAFLEGLTPGTVYHYHAVATNGVAVNEGPDRTFTTYRIFAADTECPNQAFRNGPAGNLPDCRAYEMVSPVDKGGGIIDRIVGLTSAYGSGFDRASVNGEKFTFSSNVSFGEQLGSINSNQYMATHGAGGWSSEPINPPIGPKAYEVPFYPVPDSNYFFDSPFQAFSEDLSSAWVVNLNDSPLTPDAIEGFGNLYRRDNLTGGFEALTINTPTAYPGGDYGKSLDLEVKGASADGAHQVFIANAALTPDAPLNPNRKVYDFSGGGLHLVSVLPSGIPLGGSAAAGNFYHPGSNNARYHNVKGAISADGSRIFWTWANEQIYVRENPAEEQSALAHGGALGKGAVTEGSNEVTGVTTSAGAFEIGQTITGVPSIGTSNQAPAFPPGTTITAVGAGTLTLSTVAIRNLSSASLEGFSECTEADKACTRRLSRGYNGPSFWAADPSGSRMLYEQRDVDAGAAAGSRGLYKVDVDSGTVTLVAPSVSEAVLGASDDLSRVYFISAAVLAPGAVAGRSNLYLDDEGTPTFIADLSGGINVASVVPLNHSSHVTADGRHLAFMSQGGALSRAVAGYDNADAMSGVQDVEVFLYDAEDDRLTCVSCNPSGARPHGDYPVEPYADSRTRKTGYSAAAWLPPSEHESQPRRVLAPDGNRILFNSLDSLVPYDTNGLQDVYQWEAPGTGSCDQADPSFSALNEGCVDLISTGESTREVEIVDADAQGENAFFRTEKSIDPRDPSAFDIYDARVGGGYPPPEDPVVCVGDACQSVPESPNDPTPASAAFRGAGDPVAQRNCGVQAKRAAKLSRRAKALRRRAKRARVPKRAKALRRRSVAYAKQAKRISTNAKRCRRANRRASR